jgi:hypothetical protein
MGLDKNCQTEGLVLSLAERRAEEDWGERQQSKEIQRRTDEEMEQR